MHHRTLASFLLPLTLISCLATAVCAQKFQSLESAHYRIHFEAEHKQLAGEVLEIAETVWPTLARAYDSYEHYKTIEIFLTDNSDDANGNAIYSLSRVVIYAPHLDWVMRGRANWVGNVVTHELAHIFSLRRAAWLAPIDAVEMRASTYNREVNYAFGFAWVPLVAPNWYIEGIAQLEAEEHGFDTWDSQRDMIVRDAFFTKTLPSLADIETFDGDWVASERVYNTGYAFLRYLRDRYGIEKVRGLAQPKPVFSFAWSVQKILGRSLTELYREWQLSLVKQYADFPAEAEGKPVISNGSFNQSLALSSDGNYRAWLGNDERRGPLNWIFWESTKDGGVKKSGQPVNKSPSVPPAEGKEEPGFHTSHEHSEHSHAAPSDSRVLPPMLSSRPSPFIFAKPRSDVRPHQGRLHPSERSDEIGSTGLEFNKDNTRLLTTRRGEYSSFEDIYEYEFKADRWHRLTWKERAAHAAYHPSEKKIVYVRQNGGTRNVAILDNDGRIRQITHFREGQQVYHPRFSPAGDTIWFSLGVDGKEAIVRMSAEAPGFDPFASLKDSALFPDSLYLARGETLSFFTPFKQATFRDLRFQGDTLLWSSNEENQVFNVFAKVRGDSTVYQATRVRGQAMEPLLAGKDLYYQGYQRQRFEIYRTPLDLVKTGLAYPVPSTGGDSLPNVRPKKRDFEKAAATGEYRGHRVAWGIYPYVEFSPRFYTDTISTHFSAGLQLAFGDLLFGENQYVVGEIGRQFDLASPLDYTLAYYGGIRRQAIHHNLFAWMPNVNYGFSHSTFHSHNQSSEILGAEEIGFDGRVTINAQEKGVFHINQASASMGLPLNFFLTGRYWKQSLTSEYSESARIEDFENGTVDEESFSFLSLEDASLHRHVNAMLGWGWGKGQYATWLPNGFSVFLGAQKWWARYASRFEENIEPVVVQQAYNERPISESVALQSDFAPWSADFWTAGAYSYDSVFSLKASVEAGSFMEKFPMEGRPDDIPPTELVENPAPQLWPMTYKLGLFRLPGYPYSLYYRGRNILEGTAAATAHFSLEFPYKLKHFFGIPVGPTSLYRLQLAFLGNAGFTLNRTPDKLVSAVVDREHHLLADLGVRISATFRLYHQFPITAYFQAFQPINDLRPHALYPTDYRDISVEVDEATDSRLRNAYIDAINSPRYFVGMQFGIF